MSWPSVPLGEVFEIARGGSPRPIDKFITDDPDGLNWVKIGDATASGKYILSTKEKIRKEGLSKTRAVEPGDFLLTNSMSFGRPYIMGTHGCIHDGWLVLKPRRDGTVSQDYMYHLLGSDQIKAGFALRAPGSTVKNLNSTMVAETSIPLPPLEEQRRIAGILDAADALRRRRREALALLDTLPGAIFAEMFGCQSDLPTVKIEDVVINGRTGPFGSQLLKSEFVDTGIPVLGIDNVVTNQFVEKTPRFITEEKYKALQRYTVVPGDVLITIMGTCGRCAVVPPGVPKMVNTKHLCCLTPKQEKITPEYLRAALLFDEDVHRQLEQQTKGSIMSGLNMGIIKGLSIKLPLIAEQITFATQLHNVDSQIENCKAHYMELETLFASLQSRAFAGEL